MATITVTEILGTDNVGLSRPIINENFKTLKDATNNLESFLDTDDNGALSIGSVSIPLTTGSIADENFSLASSGNISGNLSVSGSYIVNPITVDIASFQVELDGTTSFNQNDLTFTKNAGNNLGVDYNKATFESNVIINGGICLDLLAGDIIPGDYVAITPINPKKFSFDSGATYQPLNILNLDLVSAPTTTDIYLANGFDGQIIILRFVDVTGTISCDVIGNMEGDDVSTSASLTLTGVQKADTLTLGYGGDGWAVLNKYGNLTI